MYFLQTYIFLVYEIGFRVDSLNGWDLSLFLDDVFFIAKMDHGEFVDLLFKIVAVYFIDDVSSSEILAVTLFEVEVAFIEADYFVVSFRVIFDDLWSVSMESVCSWH